MYAHKSTEVYLLLNLRKISRVERPDTVSQKSDEQQQIQSSKEDLDDFIFKNEPVKLHSEK